MYMSDKWRSEPKDSEMLQILKTKQKKKKSYAELEALKKKKNSGVVLSLLH